MLQFWWIPSWTTCCLNFIFTASLNQVNIICFSYHPTPECSSANSKPADISSFNQVISLHPHNCWTFDESHPNPKPKNKLWIRQLRFVIHQILLLVCIMWLNIPQPKLGNIQEYSPIFVTAHVVKNIWRIINTIASIWLRKYACIFFLGHYLQFISSFALGKLFAFWNRYCLWTNIQAYFVPSGGYCVYYSSDVFRNANSFENWGIISDIPQF